MSRKRVELHHPDQLWWPELGLTKRDAWEYYDAIAPTVLPHLRDRPFTIKQHYNGPRSPFRWIKDKPPEAPDWIKTSPQPAKSRRGAIVEYIVVNDRETLLWLVDYGCVDLHVWTSRVEKPDRPDVVLLDLDPKDVPFARVVEAAVVVHDALAALELESVPMTTGGEGMHVRVPIVRRYGYDEVRAFARVIAGTLARVGITDVKLDVKMNGHGQQVVAPYSIRPVPSAAVATPLSWDEVDPTLDPASFTPASVLERVAAKGDLAAPLLHVRQSLKKIV
ncbi:MAG: DNA polymerase domain-containing protein [Gaiellaceae bacterium]